MSDFRLPDYLEHMQQAAADACSFIEGLEYPILTSHEISTRYLP